MSKHGESLLPTRLSHLVLYTNYGWPHPPLVGFLSLMHLKHLSELVVHPAVDANVAAGVQHQEQVGEVGYQATPAPKTVRNWQNIHLVVLEKKPLT